MRRHIGLIIAAVFLGSLAGCGGRNSRIRSGMI